MLRPRIQAVELRYGRLSGKWILPDAARPLVIAGGNGAGKTTLVEGLVRTLFGFERRRNADTARLEARRPWAGEDAVGAVWLSRGGECFLVRREFETGQVRVSSADGVVEHFHGDGSPGARNQDARHYRRILTDLVGLGDVDAYGSTLYVAQGSLRETGIGEHLLRVAAGGQVLVDAARHDIAEAHRRITARPLQPGAQAAINPRELERLDEEVSAIEERLRAAREARERRGPLALDRDRTADFLRRVEAEIHLLEEAQAALARTGSVELEARHLRDLDRRLARAAEAVGAARREREAALAELDETGRGGMYPLDFPERLARAELRWHDLSQLGTRPSPWVLALGLVLLAGAGGLALAGLPPLIALAGAMLGALAVAAWAAFQVERSRQRRRVERGLRALLEGVPAGDDLSPRTRDRALARYRAQRAAAERADDARDRLARALQTARATVRDARAMGIGSELSLLRDPEATLADLRDRALERLARGRSELDHVGEASLGLPDGVPPTEQGVRSALRERRSDRSRAQETLHALNQELLERGAPAESPAALSAELASLAPRRAELARKAEVLEAAHALIADAYDAFRDRDQERMVRLVSEHVERLTGNALGPVVARRGLDDARVRAGARLLPLASPPLSFGELHALLLAVRLGAADFLAGVGVVPPLVLDEPFAHLDREHTHALWRLLEAVAAERQVLVTCNDQLALRDLGTAPDILLSLSLPSPPP